MNVPGPAAGHRRDISQLPLWQKLPKARRRPTGVPVPGPQNIAPGHPRNQLLQALENARNQLLQALENARNQLLQALENPGAEPGAQAGPDIDLERGPEDPLVMPVAAAPIPPQRLEEQEEMRNNPQINPDTLNRIIERRLAPDLEAPRNVDAAEDLPEEEEAEHEEPARGGPQPRAGDEEPREMINGDIEVSSIKVWSYNQGLVCLVIHRSTSLVLLGADESRFYLLGHLAIPAGSCRLPQKSSSWMPSRSSTPPPTCSSARAISGLRSRSRTREGRLNYNADSSF